MSFEREMRVSKIRRGTVIDHIPAGRALDILKILGLTGKEGFVISLVMNVPSEKLGRKDIVKVEEIKLSQDDVNKIALIAPSATINIIENYSVASKTRVKVPRRIEGLLKCGNPNCITRKEREPIISSFEVVNEKPLILRCEYCGRLLEEQMLIEQLTG